MGRFKTFNHSLKKNQLYRQEVLEWCFGILKSSGTSFQGVPALFKHWL